MLGFFPNQVWTLLSLLVVEVTGDAILRSELPAAGSPREERKKQIIPKIIRQTYKTTAIPSVWHEVQAGCIALPPESQGWKYKLWADGMGLEFIQQEYERFYETYAGYEYSIQRADAIRTIPTGVSNDVTGAVPGHSFFV
ncbi:CSG1/SUR1-like protein [Elasticomyces elasticus]|nr:CSG1/SUR1-like protein [Elasticomyces elasticus]